VRWLHAPGHALAISGSMTWEILWALILGFALSAVVQAVVRRSTIIRLLGDDHLRTLAIATGFGAASSSCSYAAVALASARQARTIFGDRHQSQHDPPVLARSRATSAMPRPQPLSWPAGRNASPFELWSAIGAAT